MVSCDTSNSAESREDKSEVIQLNNIQNNYFESNNEVHWTIYVKEVDSSTCSIQFTTNTVSLKFKTNDEKFYEINKVNLNKNAFFEWNVRLNDKVIADQCKYNVTKLKIEIKLIKEKSVKWPNVICFKQNASEKSVNEEKPKTNTQTASLKQQVKSDEIKTNDAEKETKTGKNVENTTKPTTVTQQTQQNKTSNMTKQQFTGPYLGRTGLVNLGNTCYMNATLQCLANTTDFRDFFMDINFKNEINTTNPLGLKGTLAIAYAMLQRQIWSGQQPQLAPSKVRELVSEKYPNFNGYAQQDAQEFMGSLLSLLHEDLNRIQKRPVLEPLESDGWQDTRISEESWKRFLSRDDSIVVDNFFGQFKSKLTCPVCNKVSITFEAFNNVLVQLPGPKRRLNAVIMLRNSENMPIKFITDLPKSGHFKDLIDQVVDYFDVKTTNSEFYIYKVENSKITQFYKLDDSLEEFRYIDNNSVLVVNEIIKKKSVKEPVVELQIEHEIKCTLPHPDVCNFCEKPQDSLKRCTKCLSVAYCNTECQRSDWATHKVECVAKGNTSHAIPFVLTLEKSTISENVLKQLFVNHSKYFVEIHPSSDDNYEIEVSKNKTFKTLTELTNYLHETNNSMQSHKIKLVWNYKLLNRNMKEFDINQLKHVFSPSIHATSAQNQQHNTLDDCLKLFTHPEVLTPDNNWYCPKCKKHQEATKQIYLWKLPKYLIIILKRFQAHKAEDISTAHYPDWLKARYGYYLQNRVTYSKINSLIKFPLHGLNMAPYIYDPTAATNTANNSNYDHLNENVYDLYGVINHHGESLYSGHYTAFARCHDPNDTLKNQLGWRYFDDTRVVGIDESEVITKDAYVLFYRRRKSNMQSSQHHNNKKVDVDIDRKLFESNNYIKNLNINQNNVKDDDEDDGGNNHNEFSSLPSTPSSGSPMPSPSPSSQSSQLSSDSSSSDEYEDAEAAVFTNLHELD